MIRVVESHSVNNGSVHAFALSPGAVLLSSYIGSSSRIMNLKGFLSKRLGLIKVLPEHLLGGPGKIHENPQNI
jgi:hypothetical protein